MGKVGLKGNRVSNKVTWFYELFSAKLINWGNGDL